MEATTETHVGEKHCGRRGRFWSQETTAIFFNGALSAFKVTAAQFFFGIARSFGLGNRSLYIFVARINFASLAQFVQRLCVLASIQVYSRNFNSLLDDCGFHRMNSF